MPVQPPRSPIVDRRTALTSALVASGLLVAGSALSGCTVAEDKADDPQATRLATAAAQARADADAARGLAVLDGALGPQLRLIADQRSKHAQALTDELSRFLRRPTSASAAPSAAPSPALTRQAFAAQLGRSAQAAGDAAVAASGYQAGLLGSVSAATRVHAEVLFG